EFFVFIRDAGDFLYYAGGHYVSPAHHRPLWRRKMGDECSGNRVGDWDVNRWHVAERWEGEDSKSDIGKCYAFDIGTFLCCMRMDALKLVYRSDSRYDVIRYSARCFFCRFHCYSPN